MRQLVRRYRWAVLLVAAGVVLALIAGAPRSSGSPLDPRSTAGDGTKALVLLLERLGRAVHTGGALPSGDGPALMLQDGLDHADRDSLLRWVRRGHLLVDADPTSPLAASSPGGAAGAGLQLEGGADLPLGACPLASLSNVSALQPGGGTLLAPRAGRTDCFQVAGGAFLQARPEGSGVVIVLGGPDLWTNAYLGRADNSVLAADLLVPAEPGGAPAVTLIAASRVGGGDTGLLGLVSPHVWEAVWQLAVAFLVVALWRARRLGRPVTESTPVVIPASELVSARGNLLQEGRRRARAATMMREGFARRASKRLGLPAGTPPPALASAAAARAGVSEETILQLLDGPAPAGDEELVRLAQQIDDTMGEIAHAD